MPMLLLTYGRIFALEKGLSQYGTSAFGQGKGYATIAYSHNEHSGLAARNTPPLFKGTVARLS